MLLKSIFSQQLTHTASNTKIESPFLYKFLKWGRLLTIKKSPLYAAKLDESCLTYHSTIVDDDRIVTKMKINILLRQWSNQRWIGDRIGNELLVIGRQKLLPHGIWIRSWFEDGTYRWWYASIAKSCERNDVRNVLCRQLIGNSDVHITFSIHSSLICNSLPLIE